MGALQEITIPRVNDFHAHLRQDEMMRKVVLYSAEHCRYLLAMPNIRPHPILTADDALEYREGILAHTAEYPHFQPLMSIQVTPETTPQMISEAKAAGVLVAKTYPVDMTTHSENGVLDYEALDPVWATMADIGLPASFHGEKPREFCSDAEFLFLEVLAHIQRAHPQLRVVLEHISCRQAVDYVLNHDNVAATITVPHLLFTLHNVIGGGKIRPLNYCLPTAKRPEDRESLIWAATSGDRRFFFGSDSAPWYVGHKIRFEGCGGIFSAPVAIPILVEIFEREGKLDQLQPFLCDNGAQFYGLPVEQESRLTIVRKPWTVPKRYERIIVPLMAGETLQWQVAQS